MTSASYPSKAPPEVHAAVDVLWGQFFPVRSQAKPETEEPPTAASDEQTSTADHAEPEERPDFNVLIKRNPKRGTILRLLWDAPFTKYSGLAAEAEKILGNKVTHKQVASHVYWANKSQFERKFVHPSKRVSPKV